MQREDAQTRSGSVNGQALALTPAGGGKGTVPSKGSSGVSPFFSKNLSKKALALAVLTSDWKKSTTRLPGWSESWLANACGRSAGEGTVFQSRAMCGGELCSTSGLASTSCARGHCDFHDFLDVLDVL